VTAERAAPDGDSDLTLLKPPPPNRAGYAEGGIERHMPEGAVMLAFGMHLLRTAPGMRHVALHPDGEHAKAFSLPEALARRGFSKESALGRTAYGGLYAHPDGRTILVNPASGRMDVVADHGALSVGAECKGGIVNTRHPGQASRLRRGLCEAVGLLLAKKLEPGQRQLAVVPRTMVTESLAGRLAIRAGKAGISIALVSADGSVHEVSLG